MTKQEYIKSKWQEAGFVWEEIKSIIQSDGGILLDHPSLKSTLTGYSEAHVKGYLKGYDFAYSGLKVWNNLLDGVEHNNGWTKIESESDLPKDTQNYNVIVSPLSGYRTAFLDRGIWSFFHDDSEGCRHVATYDHVTHYRPIVEVPKPLY